MNHIGIWGSGISIFCRERTWPKLSNVVFDAAIYVIEGHTAIADAAHNLML